MNKKEEGERDYFLTTIIIVSFLISTIDLFFTDLISQTVDSIFWFGITLIAMLYFFKQKRYVSFSIFLVIMGMGLMTL